jgi:hypothetical protein
MHPCQYDKITTPYMYHLNIGGMVCVFDGQSPSKTHTAPIFEMVH